MSTSDLKWPQGWTHEFEVGLSAKRAWSFKDVPDFPEGSHSHRFELRAGDTNSVDGSREVRFERAECAQTGELQRRGETFWYSWSFQVPEDFPDAKPIPASAQQIHLAQFHQYPNPEIENAPWHPPWMFGKKIGGPFCVRLFPTTAKEKASWWTLIEDRDFRAQWHRLLVHARWSSGSDGFFKTWVNGLQKMAHFGPTCYEHEGPVYFKYGLYRPLSEDNSVATAHFCDLRRGDTRSAVE